MDRLTSWYLTAGGTLFFAGVALHPHEHVEGGTLEEQFHAMFSDAWWYPAHALLLTGLALMAAALVGLARNVPPGLPRRTTRFAAFSTVVGTAAMVLHLFAKLDDTNIATGANTPLLFTHAGIETLTVPLVGIAFALLAYNGGRSRSLGNPAVAALAVIGGLGYALAGATAPFTPTFTPLFDLVGLVGVWAAVVGGIQVVRGRNTPAVHEMAQ
jgi:FtsH-binding integral membrane protein